MLWDCSKSNEGGDFGEMLEGFQEVESKIIELIGKSNISDFIPLLSWFALQGMNKEMQRQLEQGDRIFNYIIERKIKLKSSKVDETYEEDGRKDFLEILLELKDQKNDPKSCNIIHIKALLIVILFLIPLDSL
ncbi:putative flavonoid 3',5'-hydroxylase [Helianthus anomalus]